VIASPMPAAPWALTPRYATCRRTACSGCRKVSASTQGLTAAYLLRRTYRVQAGDAVLIHAAAGGVGLIACQWAKALGATVIGTVGSAAKGDLAKAHGCDHVINYSTENFTQRVREITGGEGVAVVYDGVGKDVFMGSLDSLRTLGMLVTYGNASGPVPPFDPLLLAQKGSLFVTRPTLAHYTAKRAEGERTVRDRRLGQGAHRSQSVLPAGRSRPGAS